MSIPKMIRERRDRWRGQPCMLVKRDGAYREVGWEEYVGAAERVGLALVERGLEPGDKVAILSPTRFEWAVADTGALCAGGVTVPVYPTLTQPEVRDLLTRSRSRFLFAADREQVEKCLPLLDELSGLELLVAFERTALAGVSHPRAVALEDLAPHRLEGDVLDRRIAAIRDDDVATLIFTSGTTGEPKGVMLSHRNLLSNVEASLREFEIGPGDVCLAHLPLAHILERMAGYYLMLWAGATIAYAEGIQQVVANLAEVRPTLAVSVPRIFEKVYAGLLNKAVESPAPVRALTLWAIRVGRDVGALRAAGTPLPAGLGLQHRIADRLVFAKLRAKLGGRLRFFISGGAPLAPELAMFFNAAGVQIYEGYGLTETAPVTNVNTPGHNRVGTVGRFLEGVSGKIAGDGEILIRGPNVFLGYFEAPEATREAFTEDGWFMTGDIGEIDADGYLRITDRKKDLIVTAGGKNVAPQKVENALKRSKYVADAVLYGDRKKYVTALVVPDPEWLRRYASWKGLPPEPAAELVKHPTVLAHYDEVLEEVQEKAGLARYERVKKFVLLDREFSMQEGEVTPTLKVRRKIITERYRELLDALYEAD